MVGWNGVSFLSPPMNLTAIDMESDASGSWAVGHGRVHSGSELLPIILAAAMWGPLWDNRLVRCYCDNQAVVAGL